MLTVALLVLAADPVVWRTSQTLQKGDDTTFIAKGTRKGRRYVFHARGVCGWPSKYGCARRGNVTLGRGDIFGIEFRVTIGRGDHQFLNVGTKKPELTELEFVADSNDVPIRLEDHWDLPDKVTCTIDQIEVRAAR